MTPFLAHDIAQDEGCRLHAYQDTLGVWTIGYGHAFVAPDAVWTQEEANRCLTLDIHRAVNDCDKHIAAFRTLTDARQDVLVNMMFQLGWPKLSLFHHMLTALTASDFESAAAEMLDSHWANQTPSRAKRLATQMLTGVRA